MSASNVRLIEAWFPQAEVKFVPAEDDTMDSQYEVKIEGHPRTYAIQVCEYGEYAPIAYALDGLSGTFLPSSRTFKKALATLATAIHDDAKLASK